MKLTVDSVQVEKRLTSAMLCSAAVRRLDTKQTKCKNILALVSSAKFLTLNSAHTMLTELEKRDHHPMLLPQLLIWYLVEVILLFIFF